MSGGGLLQELQELLVPVFRVTRVGGDPPGRDLQRGEQGGGAVDLGRDGGVAVAVDEPVPFQAPDRLGEHFLADALNLGETVSTPAVAALPLAGPTALRLHGVAGPLASRRVLLTRMPAAGSTNGRHVGHHAISCGHPVGVTHRRSPLDHRNPVTASHLPGGESEHALNDQVRS
jgi:hypothetical protein